jgi:hypothetical protein
VRLGVGGIDEDGVSVNIGVSPGRGVSVVGNSVAGVSAEGVGVVVVAPEWAPLDTLLVTIVSVGSVPVSVGVAENEVVGIKP